MVRGLSVVCVIALAARAHADGIGIAAATASTTERSAIAQAMHGAVGESRRVVDDSVAAARDAVEAGAVPKDTLAQFRRVHDLIEEGWRAYLRVEFDFAQARLSLARQEAEGIVALPGGDELYADASLRLGIVLGQLGHADESLLAIRLALALDPTRPITQAEFSPEVVAAVDQARGAGPHGQDVTITTAPTNASVTIDGRAGGAGVGRGVVTVSLERGLHVVVARAPGFKPTARTISGSLDKAIEIDLEPDEDAQSLLAGAVPGVADAAAQRLVDATLRFAELDELVLAVDTDRRGGNALLVQRCAGAPVATCTAVVEIGYARGGLAQAAREAWAAVRTADLRYPPTVLADPRVVAHAPPPHRCEVCRSPWLWGGVTAAAVIGTIAIVAVATSSRPPPVLAVDPSAYVTH